MNKKTENNVFRNKENKCKTSAVKYFFNTKGINGFSLSYKISDKW